MPNFLQKLKNQNGIGLIEVILALGVSVIVITGMVSLAVFTVRSSLQSRLLFEGTKYANQQLEFVRAYRDAASWSTFTAAMSGCFSNCNMTGVSAVNASTKVYNVGMGQVTVFFKAVDANTNPAVAVTSTTTVVRVTSQASWTIAGVTKYAFVYTDLTNWRGK